MKDPLPMKSPTARRLESGDQSALEVLVAADQPGSCAVWPPATWRASARAICCNRRRWSMRPGCG
jgi:hypothetical protein